jgi:hypothetical protein
MNISSTTILSNVGGAPEATPGPKTPANARMLAAHPVRHRLVIPTPFGRGAGAVPAMLSVESQAYQTRHRDGNPGLSTP